MCQMVPLIKMIDGCDIVYKWFDYLKGEGHYVIGYVIMPDHIHALIAFRNSGKPLNAIIGNGKRFIAYDLVKRLKEDKFCNVLEQLQKWVNKTDAARHKQHEVFEPSFDWKECRTEKFICQKLDYIHKNPCRNEPRLAVTPEDYLHSSAKFYCTGEQGIYNVTSYTELQDVDLTAKP